MKHSLNIIKYIAALFAVAAIVSGCRKSDFEPEQQVNVEPGQPASLSLKIDNNGFSKVVTRAAAFDESAINSLAVIVFDSKGAIKTGEFFDNATSNEMRIRTTSGSNMKVVAVANYAAIDGLKEQLQSIKDYEALNGLVVATPTGSAIADNGLVMFGETVVDIAPGGSNVPVSVVMSYIFAKVNMNVKISNRFPSTESIVINGIQSGSLPVNGFLTARNDTPPTQTFTNQAVIPTTGNQNDGLSFTIYTLENRRGGRTSVAPPTNITESASNGHLFKRHYAPSAASYAVIQAEYKKNGTTQIVDMYIYFGRNNFDDYNVARSESHTYTVTINGMNNINVDTNIETVSYDFDISSGDNMNMDAHADFRPLFLQPGNSNITIEVLDAAGRTYNDAGFDAQWVKVSPIDLSKFQVRQNGQGYNVRWQAQGNPGSFVRGKHIPHQSWRSRLSLGGWNAIPSGTTNDDELTFNDATYRMCYKINDIPATSTVSNINIYADENTTGIRRTAQIAVTTLGINGVPQRQVIPITQEALVDLGVINGNHIYLEANEELTFNLYPAPQASQLTARSRAQWGYNTYGLYNENDRDRLINGEFLTINTIYGRGRDSWQQGSSSFVQKDENGNPVWNTTLPTRPLYAGGDRFNEVTTTYEIKSTQEPYYLPDYDHWRTIYTTVYGSSAASYCHEKNRDLNGDGVIDPSETKWYLPSIGELHHIWMVMQGINPQFQPSNEDKWDAAYFSSTEDSPTSATILMFAYSTDYVQNREKTSPMRIRCVRRGNTSNAKNVNYENSLVVIDNTSLPIAALISIPKIDVPASRVSNERLPKRFAVAKQDAATPMQWHQAAGITSQFAYTLTGDMKYNAPTGCATYSEQANQADQGQWRLPTVRELFRIWELVVSEELKGDNGFTPLKSNREDWYWSATEQNQNSVWTVSFSGWTQIKRTHSKMTEFNIRCVKDL